MYTDFKNSKVWIDAMCLAEKVCLLDRVEFIDSQLKRAAISVPANIAEGIGKGGNAITYSYRIAQGSCAEVETLIILMQKLELIELEESKEILQLVNMVSENLYKTIRQTKMLNTKK